MNRQGPRDRLPSRDRLRELSFTRLSPNILTVLALCAGLTAIRFGLQGKWEEAVAAIVIAGVLDASDGRLARLLGASSRFGAELDSLADAISFGVAPAMVLYVWCMDGAGAMGWAIALFYAVCCALRLARFNTRLDVKDAPVWAGRFFTGVSAPAGAGLVLLPMMLSFQDDSLGFFSSVWLNAAVMVTVAVLMVSQVPTYSFKAVRVPQAGVMPLLLGIVVAAAFMVGAPWTTLTVIGLLYAATIPFAVRSYRRFSREEALAPTGAPPPEPQPPEPQPPEPGPPEPGPPDARP